MNTPDKCPQCGAAHIGVNYWCCGSDPFFQSDRCKERAELAATKRELEKLKDDLEWAVWNLAGCDVIAMGHSKPFDYAKEHARPALDSVSRMAQRLDAAEARVRELEGLAIGNQESGDGGLWVEVFIPIERLGGANCEGEECPTLGDAMPRKEEA